MATTVTNPNYWTLTLTSNTTPVFNFKYVVDITIGGVLVARIKQPKNKELHYNITQAQKYNRWYSIRFCTLDASERT
mgnify:CR=1 FL=1